MDRREKKREPDIRSKEAILFVYITLGIQKNVLIKTFL